MRRYQDMSSSEKSQKHPIRYQAPALMIGYGTPIAVFVFFLYLITLCSAPFLLWIFGGVVVIIVLGVILVTYNGDWEIR